MPPVIINGTTGITNVNGSASTPAETGLTTNTGIYYGTNTVGLATNGTNALFIDSSQNVGVGTSSPVQYAKQTIASGNLWISSGASNQQANYSSFNYGLSFPDASGNPANGPGALITATGVSSYGADLQFITRAGAGGAALERMRIDSSGNVGIGTSSPVRKFQVANVSAGNGMVVSGSAPNISISNADTEPNSNTMTSVFALATSAGNYSLNAGEAAWLGIGNSRGNFIINPNYSGTGTKDVVINPSSGNVGIGTSSPAFKLDVSGSGGMAIRGGQGFNLYNSDNTNNMYIYNAGATGAGNGNMLFMSTAGERMRIDSSGNLLVGTTSQVSSGKFEVVRPDNGVNVATIKATSTTFNNDILQLICSRSGATTEYNALTVFSNNTGTLNMLIRANGNVQNLNNSYGAISDIKLKENIVDATPKLAQLNQVRVVNYNLKGEGQKQIGVVAQELEQIFPSMVEEAPDRDAEGNDLGTTTKSVKYSVFVPMLIKAIQEQQTIITQLQADIATLKGQK